MDIIKFLDGREPTTELVDEFVSTTKEGIEHTDETGRVCTLWFLCQTKVKGKFDTRHKLKLLLACNNLALEYYQIDQLLGAKTEYCHTTIRSLVLDKIPVMIRNLERADKYTNWEHSLNIEYTFKIKEK